MSVQRNDAKRDANETEIVDALEAIGCSVDRVPGGKGRPDLLVGYKGRDTKMEVKMPGKTLNPLQKQYHRDWKGEPIFMAFTAAGAIEIILQRARKP